VIAQIDLLPLLFERMFPPPAVVDELSHRAAPIAVRDWMQQPPGRVDVLQAADIDDPALGALDDGGRILIDERKAAVVALRENLEVAGTRGVLDLNAERTTRSSS